MANPIIPFFQGATGDPIHSHRRIAPQPSMGVAPLTGWVDYINFGGPMSPAGTAIQRQAILGTADRQQSMQGQYGMKDFAVSFGDLDPGNKAQLICLGNLFQGVRITNPASGAYRFHLSQAEIGSSLADPFFSHIDDLNTGLVRRMVDGQCKGVSLAFTKGQNVAFKPTLVFGKFDYWADPVQSVGTASTLPQVHHNCTLNWGADGAGATNDLVIKVMSFTGGVATIKVKQGTGASYGSITVAVTPGTWTYLVDSTTGAAIGTRGQQVQIYWSASPTLVANDEFDFGYRRAVISSPSYATARPIPVIDVRFFAGGNEIFTEGGLNLTLTVPGTVVRDGPMGQQVYGTTRTGFMDVSVGLTRRLVDNYLQYYLEQGLTLSAVIEVIGDTVIPTTSIPYGCTFVLPNLLPTGEFYGIVEGATKQEETLKFEASAAPGSGLVYDSASPYSESPFTAACTALVDTDISTVN